MASSMEMSRMSTHKNGKNTFWGIANFNSPKLFSETHKCFFWEEPKNSLHWYMVNP